jgi:hypothetical protein
MASGNGTPITYAVVQYGYVVFGVGSSRDEAIAEAAEWLEDEYGRQGGLTIEQVEALIVERPNNGDICVLTAGDDDFGDYLDAHGDFIKRDYMWYRM